MTLALTLALRRRLLVHELNDDDGHVVTAVLAKALDGLGAAVVQDLFAKAGQDDVCLELGPWGK